MLKYKIGSNLNGIVGYVSLDELLSIKANPEVYKSKYSNQQWAKIRKLIKKFT